MEEIKNTVIYRKCTVCCKNFDTQSLFKLSESSIVIEDESILLTDLLLDLFLAKKDHQNDRDYICSSCKHQLVSFHMFKREVLKYEKFSDHLKQLNILATVHEFIKNDDVSLSQLQNSLLISKPTDEMDYTDKNEEILNENNVKEEHPDDFIEEYLESLDDYVDNTKHSNLVEEHSQDIVYEQHDNVTDETSESICSTKKRKKYSHKSNTNDSLTENQLLWIKEQVKECEVTIGGKKKYKCSICGTILQIPGSLKKHLRDSHILKSNSERQLKESRDAFKDEIKRSKILVESEAGSVEVFRCERCPQDRLFRSEGGLKVHLRYSHIRGQIIDNEFIAKCKIIIQTETSTEIGWQCPDCLKILKSRDTLRNHMKLEHPDTVARIQNENPEKTFMEKAPKNIFLLDLKQAPSKLSVSNTNTFCEDCGIKFMSGTTKKEKSMEIHQQLHIILKVVSQNYELPKCNCCRIMFSNNEVLHEHMKTHDNKLYQSKGLSFLVGVKYAASIGTGNRRDENSWSCGHCGVCYQNEVECIAHQMILHSNQLICPVDYLEFTGVRGLGLFCSHMKNKHGEMFPEFSISCTYCGINFTNVFDKLHHMKMCDEKKFACDHCDKTFFKKTQLIRHLKIVAGVISFKCEVCSKNCISSMDLKLHYRTHTNEKTYECNFPNCRKAFKTGAHRSSHMEIHSNIEYECTDCKAIFKQRSLLQRHLKNVKCKPRLN